MRYRRTIWWSSVSRRFEAKYRTARVSKACICAQLQSAVIGERAGKRRLYILKKQIKITERSRRCLLSQSQKGWRSRCGGVVACWRTSRIRGGHQNQDPRKSWAHRRQWGQPHATREELASRASAIKNRLSRRRRCQKCCRAQPFASCFKTPKSVIDAAGSIASTKRPRVRPSYVPSEA